ncbi:hypothetical protein SNE40_014222 [Patella caerulea]|uniref:Integrase catalytic domain-containing protein n=1 Tax=Patella caerulea TaxID=87958 RepID=A0AAN8PCF4_PATCE
MRPALNRMLTKIYYNPEHPVSYSGIYKLYSYLRQKNQPITLKDVRGWLSKQRSYTMHVTPKRRYKRDRIRVAGIDHLWGLDLADVSSLKKHNNGHTFLLCVIDVLSKYAWVYPMKSKTARSIAQGFTHILESSQRKPISIQTDKGKEFLNKSFQTMLKDRGIGFYVSQNDDIKMAIVERLQRTLKRRMYHYFTKNNTFTYINVLQKIVNGYNNSKHRSIQMAPVKVHPGNQDRVMDILYKKVTKPKEKYAFNAGDYVRISESKHPFKKDYLGSYSEEIFQVVQRLRRDRPVYKINDLQGVAIKGTFYREELIKVIPPKHYDIERVISRKTVRGLKYLLVRWRGYDQSIV